MAGSLCADVCDDLERAVAHGDPIAALDLAPLAVSLLRRYRTGLDTIIKTTKICGAADIARQAIKE